MEQKTKILIGAGIGILAVLIIGMLIFENASKPRDSHGNLIPLDENGNPLLDGPNWNIHLEKVCYEYGGKFTNSDNKCRCGNFIDDTNKNYTCPIGWLCEPSPVYCDPYNCPGTCIPRNDYIPTTKSLCLAWGGHWYEGNCSKN